MFHQPDNTVGNYNYNSRIYSATGWDAHFHGNYEIIYSLKGITEICINGVPDVLYEGEMILISPYTVHSLYVGEASENWVGVFSEDHIISFSSINKFKRFSKFKCSSSVDEFLNKALFFEGKPEHYTLCACLYLICSECVNNASSYDTVVSDDYVMKVVSYISENISENVSMREISDSLNYEYHYFSNLFHRAFSMGFKAFLNHFRLEKACKMLVTSGKSITEICNACGFGSVRSFNRVFKIKIGKTPAEYRRNFALSK